MFAAPSGGTLRRCLNYWGHRKLIVDPRRVTHVENHLCIDPPMGGVDFPAEELHHNHFQVRGRTAFQPKGVSRRAGCFSSSRKWSLRFVQC